MTDAVHGAGGRIVLQLWHVGRTSHPDFHGGARIARCDGVADAVEAERAVRIAHDPLLAHLDQRGLVDRPAVDRMGAQREVEVIERHGAVVHHLVDRDGLGPTP